MNMNEIQVNLAQGINKEYELAQENYIKSQEYGTRALFHAKNCGEKLIEAKNNCEHGQWLNWLSENTSIPSRTAQRFMKIAINWDVIEAELTSNEIINFGINDAQKLLTSKNATVADLTKNDLKAYILDSFDRTKKITSELSEFGYKLITQYGSIEKFYELLRECDSKADTEDLIDSELKLHETNIKGNLLQMSLADEDMRRQFLQQKLNFDRDNDFDSWVKSQFDYEPKMIHEFITSDRSFFMDLQFEYYTPEQIAEKIKVTLGKNK